MAMAVRIPGKVFLRRGEPDNLGKWLEPVGWSNFSFITWLGCVVKLKLVPGKLCGHGHNPSVIIATWQQ